MFVCELSGCGFESSCSHFNFRPRACFKQGVPWHSCHYRVWIHSETRKWHDKKIQSKQMLFLSLKNDKQLLKNVDQYLYCQSAVKFWSCYSIAQCLTFSFRITWSPLISSVLAQVSHAPTNLSTSLTRYTNHLMMAAKSALYFLIYQKYLTKYDTKAFTTN